MEPPHYLVAADYTYPGEPDGTTDGVALSVLETRATSTVFADHTG